MTELTDRSLGLGHGDLGKREVAVCLPQTSLVKFSLRTYLVVHYSNPRGYAVKMKLILPQVVGFTFSSGTFTEGSTKRDITKLDVSFWKKITHWNWGVPENTNEEAEGITISLSFLRAGDFCPFVWMNMAITGNLWEVGVSEHYGYTGIQNVFKAELIYSQWKEMRTIIKLHPPRTNAKHRDSHDFGYDHMIRVRPSRVTSKSLWLRLKKNQNNVLNSWVLFFKKKMRNFKYVPR